MSTRIERAWGSLLGQSALKRKEPAVKDESSGQQNQQRQQEQQGSDQERSEDQKAADRASVEKAVNDLRAADDFSLTGMKVEAFNTKEGLRVRLTHASGATIKVMSAEEFLKLRDATVGSSAPGKILDQKF